MMTQRGDMCQLRLAFFIASTRSDEADLLRRIGVSIGRHRSSCVAARLLRAACREFGLAIIRSGPDEEVLWITFLVVPMLEFDWQFCPSFGG